ncbi:MAG TPA: S9 family peptidase [Terriglobales bacterium]|nr:S9 family peptidase [Terriglobales bacterium]
MKVKLLIAIIVVGLAGCLSGQTSPPPARRAITDKDIFDFVWVTNPQLSPDGSHVVFTRVDVDEKRTGYETSIWMVSALGGEAPIRLTTGKHDSQPRWSPDGKHIAFVRGGDKGDDGKPKPSQLAILSLAGGEARVITDLAKGAFGPVWSPDSKRIAFQSSTTPEDTAKAAHKKNTPPAELEKEHESDVHVISRAVYRNNEEGFLDFRHREHIWVIDAPVAFDDQPKPLPLTSGNYNEREIHWSNDGSRIYFLTSHVDEPYYQEPGTDLYSVPASGGTAEKLTSIPMGVGDVALSPDGQRVAFHGEVNQPVRSYTQPDLWVMDLKADAQPTNLTKDYDYDVGDSVFGDNAPPRGGSGHALHWSADGRSLYDIVARQGRTPIIRVDANSGAISEISHGNETVFDFTMAPDAHTIVAPISTPTMIGDLFAVSSDGAQTRLTDFNRKLWSQLNLTEPDEINYKSFDGRNIQGWIQKPPDFDPHKKYPLILNIHGGPHAAYGWVFDHEFQWMAAKGYVVLYINPRGSTSYGQDFGNIIQYHYPGDDYRDLMLGVDEVLKRGYVDEHKLAVTGGSGGGVLTDWTVTQTDRFAAAVSQRDISNWASWWYTADFTLFQPKWFKAPPFEDPQDYNNRSAITFVQKIHTPIMFVLGEDDSRTPPDSGGEQIFRALKYMKRPTAMVMFPRETHELSRSGEPWHRVERLDYIVGWFDKWLLGVPHPEFDINPPADKSTATGD